MNRMPTYVKIPPLAFHLFWMGIFLVAARYSAACSICASLSPTFCDEISAADFAVLAEHVSTPEVEAIIRDPEAYKSTFRVQKILKGGSEINSGTSVRVMFFPGENVPSGARFLIHGNWIEDDAQKGMAIRWTTPIAVSGNAIDYIQRMWNLPQETPERLIKAMTYLESDDPMLRRDAFDEFGKAPYELLEKLKPELDKHKLMSKIKDPETEPNIRKLCYTLLTICGTLDELPFLRSQIDQEQEQARESLPAIIACYLSLAGSKGLPLIEKVYLMQEGADYERRAGAAITALRFHGQEASVIERDYIAQVFLRMLQRPTLGARVLSDLARWENWSAVDEAAEIFIDATGDGLWVREPAIRYLLACPTDAAKKQILKLEKIDPLAVQNGRRFAVPPRMRLKTAATRNQPRQQSTDEISQSQQLEHPHSGGQESIGSEKKEQLQHQSLIAKRIDRWRYGIPLAIIVLFVLVLGWMLLRRQPQSF